MTARGVSSRRWQERTLEVLIEYRQLGEPDFARAWRMSQSVCRAEGLRRPRDFYGEKQHAEEDEGWLPLSAFWRRACEREWYGRVQTDYAGLMEAIDHAGVTPGRDPGGRVVILG